MAQSLSLPQLMKTTVAAKVAMAVSGLALFGFLVAHMLGNLQVFSLFGGSKAINEYGFFLHSHPMALWAARLGLLGMLVLHVVSAFHLWRLNQAARPIQYKVKKSLRSTYASRTMYWSGPIILAYVIYHLLHFTIIGLGIPGGGKFPMQDPLGPLGQIDVYKNVVLSFKNIPIALFYIVANVLLGIHLWHGLWSLFNSLGLANPKFDGLKRQAATVLSVLVIGGLIAVPLGVLFGIVS